MPCSKANWGRNAMAAVGVKADGTQCVLPFRHQNEGHYHGIEEASESFTNAPQLSYTVILERHLNSTFASGGQ
jgi:hypothetical protein